METKHSKYVELSDMLKNPETILPEDIAQYAIYSDVPDSQKHREICDLIVASEENRITDLKKEVKDLKNFFWEIIYLQEPLDSMDMDRFQDAVTVAKKALKY